MFETISVATLVSVVTSLGVPGLVLMMFYDYGRRMDRFMSEFQKQTNDILTQYREDVATTTRYYEDNVELVKNYNKLSNELCNVIHMHTQVMTQLVEKISNNMYCPLVRKRGPSDES